MSEPLYLLSISMLLGTVVLIFGMKYYAAIRQARARTLDEEAYRALAEKAVAAQSESAASLSAILAELSSVKASLAAVQKVLKEVE